LSVTSVLTVIAMKRAVVSTLGRKAQRILLHAPTDLIAIKMLY
jgi:hypothetical protein